MAAITVITIIDNCREGVAIVFETDLLRSFVAVAETLSFSEAARRLGVSQSTISQRIGRLERQTKRVLLVRDTHSVSVSDSGAVMLTHARRILAAVDEATGSFSAAEPAAHVRFGSADDLAMAQLPEILRAIRRTHPLMTVEVTVGQSAFLLRRLAAGALDLVYVRRESGMTEGALVRREQLVWGGHRTIHVEPDQPVPLVIYQTPSHSRSVALDALEAAGRRWRIMCTARDISGILAGVRAGLGVSVFPQSMMPTDLVAVDTGSALPHLGAAEFVLVDNPRASRAAIDPIRDVIRAWGPVPV